MLPAHGIAKDPPLFSISDKIHRKLRICVSRFAKNYLRHLNHRDAAASRGVRRWPLRLKIYARVQLSCCMECSALILTTRAIAISTLGIS
jgi:hypothetical protein